jgi:hypothetical protein
MIYLLTILLALLIWINPPIRKIIIKTDNHYIEKYKWIVKNPFCKYSLFDLKYYSTLNEMYFQINGESGKIINTN